jgi:hypothetical protein
MKKKRGCALWLPALLLWLTQPALAALGEHASTLPDEAKTLSAKLTEESRAAYKRVTLTTEYGLVINQFAARDGEIFAVTWSGPVMPNLTTLLGAFYPRFREEAQRPGGSRNAVRVITDELVVESSGYMRSFRGRAYLPGRLPTGVSAGDIQ